MPIYEFKCNTCQHRFSEFYRQMHSSSEGIRPPCPNCGSGDTMRMVASFAIHGPSGVDAGEAAASNAAEQRKASVTSKEQINQWRSAKQPKR